MCNFTGFDSILAILPFVENTRRTIYFQPFPRLLSQATLGYCVWMFPSYSGGLRFTIDLVQLFLARILSFFHMFTFTLFELWQLPIMLASCNRAFLIRSLVPLLCAGCCPRMIASCNQSFRTLTSTTRSKVFFIENERFYIWCCISSCIHFFKLRRRSRRAGRATVSPLTPSPLSLSFLI
jgi:hypothetical protein